MQLIKFSSGIIIILQLFYIQSNLAVDLDYTPITTVTDESRYTVLHPDIELQPFNKVRHVKGNVFFSLGERISGDRLICNFIDKSVFTKAEDVEVIVRYPKEGNGLTITAMELYADLTSDDADAFVIDGGINKSFSKVLLACNQTRQFTYELFYYGY